MQTLSSLPYDSTDNSRVPAHRTRPSTIARPFSLRKPSVIVGYLRNPSVTSGLYRKSRHKGIGSASPNSVCDSVVLCTGHNTVSFCAWDITIFYGILFLIWLLTNWNWWMQVLAPIRSWIQLIPLACSNMILTVSCSTSVLMSRKVLFHCIDLVIWLSTIFVLSHMIDPPLSPTTSVQRNWAHLFEEVSLLSIFANISRYK